MYGKEQEIVSTKAQLDLLLDKKNQLSLSAITAYDEEKKFALKQQLKSLEAEIAALRQQLQELEQASPHSFSEKEGAAKIHALIAAGDLSSALENLMMSLKGQERNTVILLQSRLNNLQKEISEGTLSNDNIKLEQARITKSALDLCDQLD